MSSVAVDMLPVTRRFRDPSRAKPRACRNLFGKPDKGEIDRLLSSEMKRIQEQDNSRYNFDFANEKPLDGKYEWSVSDVKDIPSIYRPVSVSAQVKRLPMRTTSRLAAEAEPANFALESRPVQSATELIVPSSAALPTGCLQARLQGLSSCTKPQTAAAKRTDTNVKDLFSTSTSSTKFSSNSTSSSTTSKGKSSCRRRRQDSSTSNQPKITDYLQARKRTSGDVQIQPHSKKLRRVAEENNSVSTNIPTTSSTSSSSSYQL